MEKLIYQTPTGSESIPQATLTAQIKHLQAYLTAQTQAYATLPALQLLTEQMLPTVREEWAAAENNTAFLLEITPTHLMGFGVTVAYGCLPDGDAVSAPMETWAFALAPAEALRVGLAHPETERVCPLYVENALNRIVGNHRFTVSLVKNATP